jgi:hypothetical protein
MSHLLQEKKMKLKRITPKGFIARENGYSNFSTSGYEYHVVGTDVKIFQNTYWKAVGTDVNLESVTFKGIKELVKNKVAQ